MVRRAWHPSADTRNEILDVAEELFKGRGFAKTTVADIAAEARMSPANVFRHFSNKLAILDGVGDRHFKALDLELDALPREGAAAFRLRRLVNLLASQHVCNLRELPQINEMLTASVLDRPPSIAAFRRRLRSRFQSLIEDGIANGEFANRCSKEAASNVQDTLEAVLDPLLVSRTLREEPDRDVVQQSDRLTEFVIGALRMPVVK